MIKPTSNKRLSTSLSLALGISTAALLGGCGGGSETDTNVSVINPAAPVSDWQLVWSDEFDGDAIDTSKWTHEIDCTFAGGNQEKQCYTDSPENSYLADGMLNIVALPAPEGAEQPYTSARMNTRYKGDFKYGRVEMRAKLPSGQGSWPAFWMLPTDYEYGIWPRSGEIDIVESVNLKAAREDGTAESHVYGTLHYGKEWPDNDSSGKDYMLPDGANPADDFHTYAIEWQEGEIRWYVDDYLYATQRQTELSYDNEGEIKDVPHRGWYTEYYDQFTGELTTHFDSAPFDKDFHLILNFAVGGDWPENVNELGVDAEAFNADNKFEIDYVRVYQCASDPETGKGCETVRPGYDIEASDEFPNGALVEGKANPPIKAKPVAPGSVFEVFIDDDTDFLAGHFAASGDIAIEDVVLNDDHGVVKQFTFNTDEALGYFQLPPGSVQDFRGYATLEFDIFVVNDNGAPDFFIRMDCVFPCSSGDYPIAKPAQGVWTTYKIPLVDLVNANGSSLDLSIVNTPLVFFPTWGNQEGFVAQIDNVKIVAAGASGAKEVTMLYDDAPTGDIVFNSFNPEGSVTATEIDEGDRGNVVEVVKTGATGNWYLDSSAAPFDLSAYPVGSELVFDMFVVSADADVELYIKLDSGWPNVSDVIVDTSTLGEWQEVRINLQTLLDDDNAFSPGSFADATNIVNPFVMEPTGIMTVKFDNIRYETPGNTEEEIALYDDAPTGDIKFNSFNPDGSVTANEIAEVDRGNVVEVVKTGATGNWYLDSSAAPFDISGYGDFSELVFDMYVVSADDGVELYIKIDSGWPNVSDVIVDSSKVGEWQEVRINLQTLLDDDNAFSPGSFADATNIVNPFVMEPTGVMTVKFDNIRYVNK